MNHYSQFIYLIRQQIDILANHGRSESAACPRNYRLCAIANRVAHVCIKVAGDSILTRSYNRTLHMKASRRSRTRSIRKAESREAQPRLESPYVVPMVSKAFQVLELLRSQSAPVSIDQISSVTGIHASSAYRIIRTMLSYGYVTRVGSGQYVMCREKALLRADLRIDQVRNSLKTF